MVSHLMPRSAEREFTAFDGKDPRRDPRIESSLKASGKLAKAKAAPASAANLLLLVLMIVVTLSTSASRAGSQKLTTTAAQAVETNTEQAAAFAAAESRRYKIHITPRKEALDLLAQPVLRWSNPTGGEVHGAVVLWTRNGCPAAAASIYQFFDMEQANIELVSLSESALTAERNGRVRWTPAEAGVEFKQIADAPAPTDSEEKRLLQMRALARQFSGAIFTGPDGATFTELRLLPRPLWRYRAMDNSGREGAIFAFAIANDPEILLLIESRPARGEREWLHAAARMHFCRLQLSHGERTVWEVPQVAPPWEAVRGPMRNYVILEWRSPEEAARD